MVFHVLSGALVALGIYRDRYRGHWSWRSYFAHRGIRLTLVLWPALWMTFFWDTVRSALWGSTPTADSTATLLTYLANALFLQTIVAPCAGSNGPLWSLSNEFWYYLLFPLLIAAFSKREGWLARLWALLAGGTILHFVMPLAMAVYFPIWLLGAAAVTVWSRRTFSGGTRSFSKRGAVVSTFLLLGMIVVNYLPSVGPPSRDLPIGILTASLIFFLLEGSTPLSGGWWTIYEKGIRTAANFSFSLYATHLPFLLLLRDGLAQAGLLRTNLDRGLAAVTSVVAAIAYAYLFSRVTEAHTHRVRDFIMGGRGCLKYAEAKETLGKYQRGTSLRT